MRISRLRMIILSSVALIFVACGKDDDSIPLPPEAEANAAVIDGRTYHLQGHFSISQDGRGYIDASSVELLNDAAMFTLSAYVDSNSYNRTVNIVRFIPDIDYYFNVSETYGGGTFSYWQENHEVSYPPFYGDINDESYFDGAFKGGVLTIAITDEQFVMKLTGVLVTGEEVSFHFVAPATEWEYLEWKFNDALPNIR